MLFVLRDESGRKVPSIARWVNVGSTQTTYATWDTLPPAVVGDLQVTAMTATTQTLQWSAPADAGDNSTGRATRYELRFRAAGSLATLEEFFESGRPLTGLPVPGTTGALQTYTVTGLSPDSVYFFRLISRDGAGSDRNWSAMSNEAVTPLGGGCPFVDTRTAGEWAVENSILGRSLNGTLALDSYRLRYAPDVMDGRVHLRVRENEQEITTLDQLRLIAIDHAQGVRAYGVGDKVVLGTRTAAARVTTAAGADITSQVDGSGAGFAGGPGDTLYVEFSAGAALLAGSEKATMNHDPFLIDDGGKCPPDCGSPLRSPADQFSAASIDAQILASSGLLFQEPDGIGGWRTVESRHPRELSDEAVLEGIGHGPVRVLFIGHHTIRFLGRLEPAPEAFTASKLPLLAARHTRLGDVAAAVDSIGNLTTELAPGDSVHLEYRWTDIPAGQVRELMLLSRGVYTANLPASGRPADPDGPFEPVVTPNPFASSTALLFSLPTARHTRLEILDTQGRRVRLLADSKLAAGVHRIGWDGRTDAGRLAGAGVYFYRLEAGEQRRSGRLTRLP